MSLVTLDIITPERAIFHGQVTEVILPERWARWVCLQATAV